MSKLDYKLFFYENNKLLKKISFEKGNALNLVAGNSENATLKFDNSLISRNHLQLIYDENGKLHLQDLGSTNGTFLNGNKINCFDFSKGLYFIKLEGTAKTFKLVKED